MLHVINLGSINWLKIASHNTSANHNANGSYDQNNYYNDIFYSPQHMLKVIEPRYNIPSCLYFSGKVTL